MVVMKTVKVVLGTVFGLATIVYLVQFIWVLARASFSAGGILDVFGAFVALCFGTLFTIWSFQSAFRKQSPDDSEIEEVVDTSLAPNATVSWLFIILIPLAFWIPVLGPTIGWIGIRRARWVRMPDWVAFLLACFFFIGVAITVAFVIGLSLTILGRR
jgi:hypothetical protein